MQKDEKGVVIITSKFTKEILDFVNVKSRKQIGLMEISELS
jgi:hypothetical protein